MRPPGHIDTIECTDFECDGRQSHGDSEYAYQGYTDGWRAYFEERETE